MQGIADDAQHEKREYVFMIDVKTSNVILKS